MAVRIKICGVTRREDLQTALELGVDAVGLNFIPASPRCLTAAEAAALARAVPEGRCVRVGVFADAPSDAVAAVLERVPLDALQFHGNEAAAYCEQFSRPYVKAYGISDADDVAAAERSHEAACALLLDAQVGTQVGGTGATFDWSLWPAATSRRLMLAGGLNPSNVAEAVARLKPWAVDVSSGVEGSVRGHKDTQLMAAFVAAARAAAA